MLLRSTEWDGDAPDRGDVLLIGETVHVIEHVAAGPGLGQYRIDVREAKVYRWRQ